jgi:hypothetical protein
MRRAMAKNPKRTPEQVRDVMVQLFIRYGIDLAPERDRRQDGERYFRVLYLAIQDGLLSLNRGRSSKWTGEKGLKGFALVRTVAERQAQAFRSGTTLTDAEALRELQEQDRKKWGNDFRTLEKRFYEAKRFWTFTQQLQELFPELKLVARKRTGRS